MSVIENAVQWAINIANDDSHGYDQAYRWGPDYDCSSLVISAYKQAGLNLTCTYTGNMKSDMLRNGFILVGKSNLQRGDVLLNETHHAAMYIGNGQLVQASINENGGVRGGRTGDQTGREIRVGSYYDFPWDCVLRYTGGDTVVTAPVNTATVAMYRIGSTGEKVKWIQQKLKAANCDPNGIDGEFGKDTKAAVIKFQREHNLEVDGIVGPATLKALEAVKDAVKDGASTQPKIVTTYTVPASGKLYRVGSRGDEVKWIQQKLKDAGFDPRGVDGIFGGNTRTAVINFQHKHNLEVDGIVGDETIRALKSV